MREITAEQVTPALQALFTGEGLVGWRSFGALDGVRVGRIFTDDPVAPRWGAVQELPWETVFLGGALDADLVAAIFAILRREGDVSYGARPGVPYLDLLPPDAEEVGVDMDFSQRDANVDLERLAQPPAGLRLERIDHDLLPRCTWGDLMIAMAGSAERALTHGLGYCLMQDENILSEANAGPATRGVIEAGTITDPRQRGRGYATIVSARTLLECERLGYETCWNCAEDNPASGAIARKLGYQRVKEYRGLVWRATTTEHEPGGNDGS